MIKKIIKSYNGKCIIDSLGHYSYEDLNKAVSNYQKKLELHVKKGDSVVINSDYNFYSIAIFISLIDLKVNIAPLVKSNSNENIIKIKELDPNIILTIDSRGIVNIDKKTKDGNETKNNNNNTGVVLFSSGTTGKPKMMIQNLEQIISQIKVPKKQKTLRFMIFLMFDHIGGLNTLLNCLISGSPIIIPKHKNPSHIIKLIYEHKVNVLPTSPTFLNFLLMSEDFNFQKLKSLRLITYGTERMSEILLTKLNKLLPNVKLIQTFGTSETGILKTKSLSSNSLFFKITDDNQTYKVVDGELYIKSKTSVGKYLNDNNNSNFKENGWYASGDLVEEKENGYLKIIGRVSKIINVGGLKVLPGEVEKVINSVDGVIDSTVYGEKSPVTGQIVCAKVFTKNFDKKTIKNSIKKKCRNKLDKYKVPIKINFESPKISDRGKKNFN